MAIFIPRPDCAVVRCTILCLYVPGFQVQIFKNVPKFKWISLTNFLVDSAYKYLQRKLCEHICFVVEQRAKTANWSGFATVSAFRKM